jgi:mannose-6-phosphate isomerase class I
VNRLHDRYPGDASVAATILLNHVVLEPGEAIHRRPGTSTHTCTVRVSS